MIKIYTKKGDGGKTFLANGKMVWKDNQRIKAYGTLDELNSWLGMIISYIKIRHSGKSRPAGRIQNQINTNTNQKGFWTNPSTSSGLCQNDDEQIIQHLLQIQSDLMTISSILANLFVETRHGTSLQKKTKFLESWIDSLEKDLPSLKNFILPGGSLVSSYLHITRNVCRHAEREIVSLSKKEKIPPEILIHINRLSDLFFILARWKNKKEKQKEIIWKA